MISILWLTGGHGFIGSHLINKLSKDYSLKVYCLENKQIAFPQVIRTESGRTCVSLNFKDKNHLSWLTNSSDVQKPNYLLLLGWSAVNYPTSTVHQTENVESTFLIYEATPKTLLRKVLFLVQLTNMDLDLMRLKKVTLRYRQFMSTRKVKH